MSARRRAAAAPAALRAIVHSPPRASAAATPARRPDVHGSPLPIRADVPLEHGMPMDPDEMRVTIFCVNEQKAWPSYCLDVAVRVQHPDGSDAAHTFLDRELDAHSFYVPGNYSVGLSTNFCTALVQIERFLPYKGRDLPRTIGEIEFDDYVGSVELLFDNFDVRIVSVRRLTPSWEHSRVPLGTNPRRVSFICTVDDYKGPMHGLQRASGAVMPARHPGVYGSPLPIRADVPLEHGMPMDPDEMRVTIFCVNAQEGRPSYCLDVAVRVQHADGSDAAHTFLDRELDAHCVYIPGNDLANISTNFCTALVQIERVLPCKDRDPPRLVENVDFGDYVGSVELLFANFNVRIVSVRRLTPSWKLYRVPLGTNPRRVSFICLVSD